MEGVFLKEFPPEADTIKNLEDAQAFLATEGAQQKFEGYVKSWMKKIQVQHFFFIIKCLEWWNSHYILI